MRKVAQKKRGPSKWSPRAPPTFPNGGPSGGCDVTPLGVFDISLTPSNPVHEHQGPPGETEGEGGGVEKGREGRGGEQRYTKKLFAGRLNRLFIGWGVLGAEY